MPDEVLLLSDEAMVLHDPGPGHPERPDRLRRVLERLRRAPIAGARWAAPHPAPLAALQRVHTSAYIKLIDSLRGRSVILDDSETMLSTAGIDAAYLAAGAGLDAVTAVAEGQARRAFALVRPPGHHAESDRAMGFCVFNNVAVAAAHALAQPGRRRVLIVDWDVHHGNGTQNAFLHSPDVLFFSTHRYPFYPGSGAADEVGEGDGEGFTVNVPLPPGYGDAEHLAIFEQLLAPIAESHRPDLILVSAGFDSHRDDLLGDMAMTEAGFASLCHLVCELADRLAGGRLALLLEGGYHLDALAASAAACVEVLAGRAPPPLDTTGHTAGPVIEQVREVQRGWF